MADVALFWNTNVAFVTSCEQRSNQPSVRSRPPVIDQVLFLHVYNIDIDSVNWSINTNKKNYVILRDRSFTYPHSFVASRPKLSLQNIHR